MRWLRHAEELEVTHLQLMPGSVDVGSIVGWRAWFDELTGRLSRYDSATTRHADLPRDGLLTIRAYYIKGYDSRGTPYADLFSGDDTYVFYDHPSGELVIASNYDSVVDNEARYPGATIIRGRYTTGAIMDEALAKSHSEKDAP